MHKAAFDMLIRDWSSDVCSSDLRKPRSDPMSRFKKTLVGSVSALAMTAGLALGVDAAEPYDADALNALLTIVLDASALPEPITRDHADYAKVELESVERVARLAGGTDFTSWNFNGKVPGPM